MANDDQPEYGEAFQDLHQPGRPFVLPNAYDVGSAMMLAGLGAEAIATTSAGFAFTLGKRDGARVTRDQMLDHCEDICRAVDLPVSADLENGYEDDPDGLAETIELAAEVGLVGCTIEDTTFSKAKPAYDFDIAVARIAAAVEAAEALPFPFTLTARADGVMTGAYDLEEGIRRLQAFEEVGAHCLYLPHPTGSMGDIATICGAVGRPVNVLAAGGLTKHRLADFAQAGAARISIGGGLARVTHRMVHDLGKAMLGGDFSGLALGMPGSKVDAYLSD